MAVQIKQSDIGQGQANSVALSLPAAPIAGNLGVILIAVDKTAGGTTLGGVAGWTILFARSNTSVSMFLLYKVLDGSEQNVTPTVTDDVNGSTAYYAELEDPAVSGSSWQVSTSFAPTYSDATTTSRSTGTSPTANVDGLALAGWGIDSRQSATGYATGTEVVTFSNGYTERSRPNHGTIGGGAAGLYVASKSVTAGLTTESTFGYTGTADQVDAVLAVFSKVPGGLTDAATVLLDLQPIFHPEMPPPRRAIFYYPWFPETWIVGGKHVFYNPVLGYYDSDVQSVVDSHIPELDYANIGIAIASWWGINEHNEAFRIPLLLNRTAVLSRKLKWCMYYEKDGFADVPQAEIEADLAYILKKYTTRSEYAFINGKPVIFVYNADDIDQTTNSVQKWVNATAGKWFLVMKVFPGYTSVVPQPDSWHQYGPSAREDRQAGYSFTVSPGYWRANDPAPLLLRDPAAFNQAVRNMVLAGDPFQLITTYNEWGEGTSIEEEANWGTTYLDILANDGTGKVDSGYGFIDLQPSGTEAYIPGVDAGTAVLALKPSGTDEHTTGGATEYLDTGTSLFKLVPSAAEVREQYDTATIGLKFTPSAIEIAQLVDVGTLTLKYTVTATGVNEQFDVGTLPLQLTSSAVEIAQFEDVGTERLLFILPDAQEGRQTHDSATLPLLFTPAAEIPLTDTAVTVVRFHPFAAVEIHYLFDTLLEGNLRRRWDGVTKSRWAVISPLPDLLSYRWAAIFKERKWAATMTERRWTSTGLKKWVADFLGRGRD